MAYFYSAHNFGTGEHFGFDVISSKVFQIELQSSRKSDNVLTQYPGSKIPPIYDPVVKVKNPYSKNY